MVTEKVIKKEKKDIVEYRKVKTGALRDGLRVIESGIGRDDWIVVEGLQFAMPGSAVSARAKGSRAVGNEGCEDLEASRRLGQEIEKVSRNVLSFLH